VTTRGLRLTLIAGFGGMLVIFLVAAVDSVRLLQQMRADNQILRAASLERSRRLASVRSYILLSHRRVQSKDHSDLRNALARALENLAGYRTSTLDETTLLNSLRELLEQDWRDLENPRESTSVLEIDTRVQDVDERQLAATESEIQRQFEDLGRRLSLVLIIALSFALLLAAGCIIYIFKIERQNSRRYKEILDGRKELEQLSARLVAAQETERRAISRELHDEVGQTLGAVLVDAANLANRIPAEDTMSHRYLDNIRALADSSVNSIRNIALLLRPSMLDDLGLIPALEWQAREVSRRSGIKVKVTAENVPDSLPDALRTCIYRVVQETLHNVSRHSGAKNVLVSVQQAGDSLVLTVKDDGSGFDPEKTRGLGLLGMEERVKQLGGRLEIQSQPGHGTVLRATLPIPAGTTE
jgi:signal transduction histidine kinase